MRTLESNSKAATHWSTRSIAEATGLNQTAISLFWRASSLQPHRQESFKLSRDPLFIDKVRDIVSLYLDPPDRALVLCVDEKPDTGAGTHRTLLPLRPGQAERRAHDYHRHGTISLFAVPDTSTGKIISQLQRRRRSVEFRRFLETIEANVPPELNVHLEMYNAHPQDARDTTLASSSNTTTHNQHPSKWTKSADAIIHTFAKYCARTYDSPP